MTRTWLAPVLAGTVAGATFIALPAIGVALIDEPGTVPGPVPATTTTTEAPAPDAGWFCDGRAAVYPGTGVVDYSDRCPVPVVHEPAGTGPTTGPNGEPR